MSVSSDEDDDVLEEDDFNLLAGEAGVGTPERIGTGNCYSSLSCMLSCYVEEVRLTGCIQCVMSSGPCQCHASSVLLLCGVYPLVVCPIGPLFCLIGKGVSRILE